MLSFEFLCDFGLLKKNFYGCNEFSFVFAEDKVMIFSKRELINIAVEFPIAVISGETNMNHFSFYSEIFLKIPSRKATEPILIIVTDDMIEIKIRNIEFEVKRGVYNSSQIRYLIDNMELNDRVNISCLRWVSSSVRHVKDTIIHVYRDAVYAEIMQTYIYELVKSYIPKFSFIPQFISGLEGKDTYIECGSMLLLTRDNIYYNILPVFKTDTALYDSIREFSKKKPKLKVELNFDRFSTVLGNTEEKRLQLNFKDKLFLIKGGSGDVIKLSIDEYISYEVKTSEVEKLSEISELLDTTVVSNQIVLRCILRTKGAIVMYVLESILIFRFSKTRFMVCLREVENE